MPYRSLPTWAFLCSFFLLSFNVQAQFRNHGQFRGDPNWEFGLGARCDYLTLDNDLSYFFKPAVVPQLVLLVDTYDKRVRACVGLGYTEFTPKGDTFRQYTVDNRFNTEDVTWTVSRFYVFYGDVNFRCFKAKGVSLWAGFGLNDYIFNYQYAKHRDGVFYGNESDDALIFGLRHNVQLQYQVTDHLEMYIANNLHLNIGVGGKFNMNTVGIGLNYHFKPISED